MTVAALDCGTNSTRLLVSGDRGEIVDRQMRVTRLGQGVDTNRMISPEAIERTLTVLRDYRARMDANGVTKARMVATSAARDAANSDEFLSAAEEVTGVKPELLSGDDEGRLSFRGATADIPAGNAGSSGGDELVVDIGGGSTELVVGIPGDWSAVRVLSLDIGCVRVTERFLCSDPPTGPELEEAHAAVRVELEKAKTFFGLEPGGRIIGLAGTVSTLGSLALKLADYERNRVHHSVLLLSDVDEWLEKLASETTDARKELPGMDPGRADVILGGVLILSEVMSTFGRDSCLVSEADILDGMVASLL